MTKNAAYPDHLDRNERKVIDRLIKDALAIGCTISVHDGEEFAIRSSDDYAAITAEVAATDETTLRVRDGDLHAAIFLVHGNLPSEVISDMTDTPWARSIIVGAEMVAAKLEEKGL
jgi:pimeloyl-CoA synthetase